MCDVFMISPGFIFSVAIIYFNLSLEPTNAISLLLCPHLSIAKTFSSKGGPSIVPTLRLSTQ